MSVSNGKVLVCGIHFVTVLLHEMHRYDDSGPQGTEEAYIDMPEADVSMRLFGTGSLASAVRLAHSGRCLCSK